MGGSQHATASRHDSVIRTVRGERTPAENTPAVVLSQQLEEPADDVAATETSGSLWSKLRAPRRFLLPRTDAGTEETETDVEPAQGLDDGF